MNTRTRRHPDPMMLRLSFHSPIGDLVAYCHQFPARRFCLLSSRLGKNWRGRPEWFDSLETLGTSRRADWNLLTTARTTVHPFVEVFAKRHSLLVYQVKFARSPTQAVRRLAGSRDVVICRAASDEPFTAGERTQALAAVAAQVDVVQMDRNSLTERTVRWLVGAGKVVRATSPHLEIKEINVVPLMTRDRKQARTHQVCNSPLVSFPSSDSWLIHWTRAQQQWPDQSRDEFIESLLSADAPLDSSSWCSLLRIISMRRICASRGNIKQGPAVVCLSAAHPSRLRQGPVYRRHRHRWDFEPYGVFVRKSAVRSLGAGQVRYVSRDDFDSLLPGERTFLQCRSKSIDWSEEQEWRLIGDLQLDPLPRNDVMVFVATKEQAEQMRRLSPWPVTVVPPQ